MVYFRYDASSSVITSHADPIRCLDVCYSTWFIRVGKSEGKVFILTNTILYLCHVRP